MSPIRKADSAGSSLNVLLAGGLMVVAGMGVTGCSVNTKGLARGDAGAVSIMIGGATGGAGVAAGTGGATVGTLTGTGGASAAGGGTGGDGTGGTGTGGTGIDATGGAMSGSGGNDAPTGSGGTVAIGSGGSVGTGGLVGTGGIGTASGGVRGAGGGRGGAGGRGGVPGVAACDASNCANGCCMGSMCVTNRTDQRCGNAGAACAPCDPCYQCSNRGVCGLTPGAPWDVICSSATLTPTMPMNANGAWDAGNGVGALPDPFCQFTRNGNAQATTTTLMNTLAPVWDESIAPANLNLTQNFLVSQAWEVTVIDDDGNNAQSDLACSVAPQLTAADFAAGTVALPPTQRCTSLTIKLVCAQ